jgi:hypothetical protein
MTKFFAKDKNQSHNISNIDIYLAISLGVFWIGLFSRTLAPGLLTGDSGEFQFLTHQLGHAHTTGYPVYLLFGKLFTLIPIKDIAFRVNFFSAFTAGITLVFLYLSCLLIWSSRFGSLIGTTCIGISSIFWSQAVIAEVYTPGSLFTSGIIFTILLWWYKKDSRYLFIAGLLGGLSIGVHVNVSLLLPAVILLMVTYENKSGEIWLRAITGVFVGVILSIAAFMVVDIRSGNHDTFSTIYRPAISSWNLQPEDIDSPQERFLFLYTATQWRSAMFMNPWRVMPDEIRDYALHLTENYSLVALFLALLGVSSIIKKDSKLGLFFLFSFLSHNIFVYNYPIGDIYVYYIPGFLVIAIFIAGGVTYLLQHLRISNPTSLVILKALVQIGIFLGVIYPFLQSRINFVKDAETFFDYPNYPAISESINWKKNLIGALNDIEDNAILLTDWDNVYPSLYILRILQNRYDVIVVELKPFSKNPSLADSTINYIYQNIDNHPIYLTYKHHSLAQAGFHLDLIRKGSPSIYRISRIEDK